MKKFGLKITAVCMLILLVVAGNLPPETGWVGAICNILPFSWLFCFIYANAPFCKGE